MESEDGTSSDESENVFTSASEEDILADLIVKEQFRNQTTTETTKPIQIPTVVLNTTNTNVEVPQQNSDTKKKRGRPRYSLNDKSNDTSLDFNYSSDDTSSRGTLDSIIPPPKNFSGINNPFLIDTNLFNSISTAKTSNNGKINVNSFENILPSTSSILPPTKNAVQLVRTVKRRLSANDIIIGPNMEVKRRKLKKRLENVEVISTSSLADLPASATYLPISADSKRISLATLRSTLKDLPIQTTKQKIAGRKKQESMSNSEQIPSTSNQNDSLAKKINSNLISSISSSPIKDSMKEESMDDLKSSLNIYFGGVSNRIENGDNFAIKGNN